ncbi:MULTISPECIES: FtsX-like permease family protein [Romboutsia]|uniref:FtsX-like permease family protein n=1 Tax=Romboutsia TaxID=1501226 RepID=UPI00258978E2|nr:MULTISPECIES: ABC transporter permease [Romboutsia]
MILFKLSLRNIKKSFKDYTIYFFTLILGITIFYSFNSLETQSVTLNLSKVDSNSITIITTVLSAVSVFVAVVLGFLIIYANRFLMKRRNKELGIYMILGMGKVKISRIIVFETILIGLISLVVGIILGIATSQVMSIVVANLFEADMNKFKFAISYSAIIKTIICFLIIYTLVTLLNIIQVNKCKLIDLIKSNQKSEQVKIKNPYICIIVFILGVAILSYAYYNVTLGQENLQASISVYLQIVYGVIGTFLVFWSLSGFLLKVTMSMKNVYFNNLNSFTIRQISSKINTTVVSMSIICIMIFVTICIFSSVISMNTTLKSDMKNLARADISIQKDNQSSNTKLTIKKVLEDNGLEVNKELKDIVNFNSYATSQVTKKETYGSYYKILNEKFKSEGMDTTQIFNTPEILVRISDYNKIATLYNKPTYTLNDNQFMIISDYKNTTTWYNNGLKDGTSFELNGKTYTAKYKECKDGHLMMMSNANNLGFIVVPDDAVDESMISGEFLAANYNKTNKYDKQKLEDKIVDIQKVLENKNILMYISTKIDIYNDNIGTSAMGIFVGLYIGIVFLISSAAILSLKELSDATDSKVKYGTLRKIGIDEKMINKSLFIQTGIFFGFPLVLAIIHSIFGIQVANMMLETFTKNSMIKSIVTTALFLILIYGGYFVVTYLCSKNIIKED